MEENLMTEAIIVEQVKVPNHHWSMDFVAARLEGGMSFRILTVVDQFTRECVAMRMFSATASRSDIPFLTSRDLREDQDRFELKTSGSTTSPKPMAWERLALVTNFPVVPLPA